jgi:predicted aspartyl protease
VINGFVARVLFDSGATHSFISTEFFKRLCLEPKELGYAVEVITPTGNILLKGRMVCDVSIIVEHEGLTGNFMVMDMNDFDVILGMDWLSCYNAVVDCKYKRIKVKTTGDKELVIQGGMNDSGKMFVSMIKMEKLL